MSDDAVVSTAPETPIVETSAETVTETPVVETPETEAPKVLSAEELQKQFDRSAAAQRRKYERDIQTEREARIRLEEQIKHLTPAERKAETSEPQLKDYENFDEYVTAKAKFIAENTIKSTLSENEKRVAEARAQEARQQSSVRWTEQVSKILTEIPDFHDVVDNSTAPVTQVMQDAIDESSHAAKLVHYLASHADEAEKIARMTPIGAVRALTLIEEGFNKPVAVTKAAPPITPTGSRSTAVKSLLDVTTQAEFEKRRREFRANQR